MLLYTLNPERAVTGSRVSVRIMKVTQRYLHATDKCREMAGLVAAKFVTRPDNVKRYLPELIDWTLTVRNGECASLSRVLLNVDYTQRSFIWFH